MQYSKVREYSISKFTLGTVQLGMDYGIANQGGKPDAAKGSEILQAAVDGGVNSFDTALLYGDSEIVLGNYFSANSNVLDDAVITTKFKIVQKDVVSSGDVEKQIYNSIEQSLQRLKISKIPIYMLHNPQDMTLYGKIVPQTLEKLKNEGLIEKAAVSVYTSDEVDEMLKNDTYEAIQIPMNIMDNRIVKSGALERLYKANRIVFVRSIFLQGLFFTDPGKLKGNLKEAGTPLRNLAALADKEGISVAQLALSYIRDMEGITSLVVGAETPEQVRENIKLMEGPGISEKARYETYKLFDNIPEYILNPGLWPK